MAADALAHGAAASPASPAGPLLAALRERLAAALATTPARAPLPSPLGADVILSALREGAQDDAALLPLAEERAEEVIAAELLRRGAKRIERVRQHALERAESKGLEGDGGEIVGTEGPAPQDAVKTATGRALDASSHDLAIALSHASLSRNVAETSMAAKAASETVLARAEAELTQLRSETAAQAEELGRLRTEREHLTASMAEATAAANESVAAARMQVSALTRELEAALKERESEAAASAAAGARSKGQLRTARQELARLDASLRASECERSSAQRKLAIVSSQLEALLADEATSRAEVERIIAALRAQVEESQTQGAAESSRAADRIEELMRAKGAAEEALTACKAQASAELARTKADMQAAHEETKAEVAAARNEARRAREEGASMSASFAHRNAAADEALQRSMDGRLALEARCTNLEAERARSAALADTAKREADAAKRKADDAMHRAEQYQNDLLAERRARQEEELRRPNPAELFDADAVEARVRAATAEKELQLKVAHMAELATTRNELEALVQERVNEALETAGERHAKELQAAEGRVEEERARVQEAHDRIAEEEERGKRGLEELREQARGELDAACERLAAQAAMSEEKLEAQAKAFEEKLSVAAAASSIEQIELRDTRKALADARSENVHLRAEVASVTQALSSLETKYAENTSALKGECAEQRSELQRTRKEAQEVLERTRSVLEDDMARVRKSQSSEVARVRADHADELSRVRDEMAELREALERARQSAETQRKDFEAERKVIAADAEEKATRLLEEAGEREADLRSELKHAKTQQTSDELTNSQLSTQLSEQLAKTREAKTEADTLKARNKTLEARHVRTSKALMKLNAGIVIQLRELKAQLAELESTVQIEVTRVMADFERQMDAFKWTYKGILERETADAGEDAQSAARDAVASLRARHEQETAECKAEFHRAISTATDALVVKEKELEELRRELDAHKLRVAEFEQRETSRAPMDESVKTLKTQLHASEMQVTELTRSLEGKNECVALLGTVVTSYFEVPESYAESLKFATDRTAFMMAVQYLGQRMGESADQASKGKGVDKLKERVLELSEENAALRTRATVLEGKVEVATLEHDRELGAARNAAAAHMENVLAEAREEWRGTLLAMRGELAALDSSVAIVAAEAAAEEVDAAAQAVSSDAPA